MHCLLHMIRPTLRDLTQGHETVVCGDLWMGATASSHSGNMRILHAADVFQ